MTISQHVKAILQANPNLEIRDELLKNGVDFNESSVRSAITYWRNKDKKLDFDLLDVTGKLFVIAEDVPLSVIKKISDLLFPLGREDIDKVFNFLSQVKGEPID